MKKPIGIWIICSVYLIIGCYWLGKIIIDKSYYDNLPTIFLFCLIPLVLSFLTFQCKWIARWINSVFAFSVFFISLIFLLNDLGKGLSLKFLFEREGLFLLVYLLFPLWVFIYINFTKAKELFRKNKKI